MDLHKLRAWWSAKQGLDGSLRHLAIEDCLKQTGWQRSVGGASPYLALFARMGAGRQAVDDAVEQITIHELPSARGCTYVLPQGDFALGLRANQANGEQTDYSVATRHLGVTAEEISQLGDAIVRLLENGPLDPKEMKPKLGDQVRSFGEEGKKRGVTTTLPIALGRLQSEGRIRRIPVGGRLDQQRYRYAVWSPSPLALEPLAPDDIMPVLAVRYFAWIGPARKQNFAWFAGIGLRAAEATMAAAGLVPVEPGSEWMLTQEDQVAYAAFHTPEEPSYALVGSIDSMLMLRRELIQHLEPEDLGRQLISDQKLVEVGAIQELSSHPILDRGRVIGLWEYDPFEREIVWDCFVRPTPELGAKVRETEAWIRDDLGDFRSFSLDSPESRRAKLDRLRRSTPRL